MKWLIVMLVAANLLTFVWFSQHQEATAGSRRIPSHAVTPDGAERLWLLSELEAMAEAATDEAATDPESPPHPVNRCQAVGPLKDREAADDVITWLKGLGREGSVRSGKANVRIGYWVHLKSMPAKEVERVMQEMKEKGVEDYNRNDQNEISLGIYVKQPIAERRLKSIAALGYTPQLKPLYRNRTRYWVDVTGTNTEMLSDEEWSSHLAKYPDSRRQSIKCPSVRLTEAK